MILASLTEADRYRSLHPDFAAAFQFLRQPDLAQWADGTYAVAEDRLFALVSRKSARTRPQALLEAHRHFIDIQLLLAGEEELGWRNQPHCTQIETPYQPERDIEFYSDEPQSWLSLTAGHFALFFPEDAHAPMVGRGLIHKVVFKVAVDESR